MKYKIEDVANKNDIWLIQMFVSRISFSSKKLTEAISLKISDNYKLLLQAEAVSNKLCNEEFVDEEEIKNLLIKLKELQSFVLENKIELNHSYSNVVNSFESMINAFEYN